MISAGIDCGAKNTKAVILVNGEIVGRGLVLTAFDQPRAVEDSLALALKEAGIPKANIHRIAGTGSGKNAIETAQLKVNEIKAIGKGANFYFPGARTVIDVGAESVRAAKLDATGNALDFSLNEKCAAGTGSFIEAMSRALETPIAEMGPLSLTSEKQIPMNAQCAIFAESEVIGLIHSTARKEDIIRSIHDAMAGRIASLIRRIGVNEDIIMIGGVARNPGFVVSTQRELNLDKIFIPDHPEFGAATGAAILAATG